LSKIEQKIIKCMQVGGRINGLKLDFLENKNSVGSWCASLPQQRQVEILSRAISRYIADTAVSWEYRILPHIIHSNYIYTSLTLGMRPLSTHF